MRLDPTEEQAMFRHGLERFLEKEYDFEKRSRSLTAPDGINPAIWQGLAELGLFMLPIPEACGGLGYGPAELGMAMEVLGRHLVVEPVLPTLVRGAYLLALAGDEAQRDEWLVPVMSGSARIVLAHEEGGAEIATRARKTEDGWILHGRKPLVFGAPGADRLIVSARANAPAMVFGFLAGRNVAERVAGHRQDVAPA